MWKDLFFCAADSAIPKVQWKKSKVKHWFSYETIHLIKLKRRLYKHMVKSPTSDFIKSKYKQISNLVRSRTRQDTEAHVSNLSKQYFDSPKPFWRWLHSFKGNCSPIPPLLHNDENLTEDFNIPGLRESLSIHPSIIDSIQFTTKDVFEELISLQCDKACGPDLLPVRLLKLGAEFLEPSLAQLFQLSLSSGNELPLD